MNRHERRRKQKEVVKTTTPNVLSTQILIEAFGPSGIPGTLTVIGQFPGDKRLDSDRLHDTSLRQIHVCATVSKAPALNDGYKFNITPDDGSSYLLVSADTVHVKFDTDVGDFIFKKNKLGELAFLEFDCIVDCITAASLMFRKAVLPVLDHLSYINNCPIILGTVLFKDLKNQFETIEYVSPYQKSLISNAYTVLQNSMRPVYSMYREAQNATSNFYKFLCYYKIIEGLLGKMRGNAFKTAKEMGVSISASKILVPEHPEIPDYFRQYAGRSVKDFFDAILTPQFRNATAHFHTDEGILDVSDPEHLQKYAAILLICEICARAVIADQEAILLQLSA